MSTDIDTLIGLLKTESKSLTDMSNADILDRPSSRLFIIAKLKLAVNKATKMITKMDEAIKDLDEKLKRPKYVFERDVWRSVMFKMKTERALLQKNASNLKTAVTFSKRALELDTKRKNLNTLHNAAPSTQSTDLPSQARPYASHSLPRTRRTRKSLAVAARPPAQPR